MIALPPPLANADARLEHSYAVKGWCPGALRPMVSGDGLVMRVRPRSGRLTLAQCAAVADAGRRFGNGHFDITRRGNVQVRGLTEAAHEQALAALIPLDLIDGDAAQEAVRNVLLSPLAGLDSAAPADGRAMAADLEARLATDHRLHALPAKFAFVIDDGSALSLRGEEGDIHLSACHGANGTAWLIEIDCHQETHRGRVRLGIATSSRVVAAAGELALGFLELGGGRTYRRLRDVPLALHGHLRARLGGLVDEAPPMHSAAPSKVGRVGAIRDRRTGAVLAFGMAVPFGTLSSAELDPLIAALDQAGVRELRLSPWRALYVPLSPATGSAEIAALEAVARACGLITRENDPLLRASACTGAPGCPQGYIATRALARTLAGDHALMARVGTIHVSGCAKSCATSQASGLVITGTADACHVALNATPAGAPGWTTSPSAPLPPTVRADIIRACDEEALS